MDSDLQIAHYNYLKLCLSDLSIDCILLYIYVSNKSAVYIIYTIFF